MTVCSVLICHQHHSPYGAAHRASRGTAYALRPAPIGRHAVWHGRASYLPLVVASMPTFSHVQFWPSYAAGRLDQAEQTESLQQSFRKALDGARQTSMVHGLHEAKGRWEHV
jgi:hypothetical protein